MGDFMKRLIWAALFTFFALWAVATVSPAYAQSDGVVLTNETLLKTLSDMGLETRGLSKGYLVTVHQDSWTLYVQFVLSDDTTKLGMNANLGEVNEAAVTADQWKTVLATNNDIDPSSFNYDPKQKKLYMHRVMDNRGLTPAILRGQLDYFLKNIRETDNVWSPVTK